MIVLQKSSQKCNMIKLIIMFTKQQKQTPHNYDDHDTLISKQQQYKKELKKYHQQTKKLKIFMISLIAVIVAFGIIMGVILLRGEEEEIKGNDFKVQNHKQTPIKIKKNVQHNNPRNNLHVPKVKQTKSQQKSLFPQQSVVQQQPKRQAQKRLQKALIKQQQEPQKQENLQSWQKFAQNPFNIPKKTRKVAGIYQIQRNFAKKQKSLTKFSIYKPNKLSQIQKQYFQNKYNISKYKQIPFCIVIPSFNNVKDSRHLNNINSILMQDYSNYHIVFIDDGSTDGTGIEIQMYLQKQTRVERDRFVFVRNEKQKMAMPNLRRAAKEFCKPEEVFLIVDGDDELLGRQVLKLYSATFQKQDAWFVYSNFLSSRGHTGYSRPFPQQIIQKNKYRKYSFVTSHLRAFYTQLFLNIKQQDLKDNNGNYLRAANDVAICLPILEMSHKHVFYLKQMTYYYNSRTGLNNHQLRLQEQRSNDRMLRKRNSYGALGSLFEGVYKEGM